MGVRVNVNKGLKLYGKMRKYKKCECEEQSYVLIVKVQRRKGSGWM